MRDADMQAARALVTKAEMDVLLAPSDPAVPVEQETAADSPPVAGSRLMEQALRFWEQTARDLQREVKTLRERVDRLERVQEAPQPAKPIVSEPPAAAEPEMPRLSRAERHRRSRWF